MEKQKFWRTQWFTWTILIVCPIVGIIILWSCNKNFNNKKKIILTIIFLFWAFLFNLINSTNKNIHTVNKINDETYKNELSTKWLLVEHEYKEKYPYTENYLNTYCQGSAVWLETTEGDLYSLNNIAKIMLQNDKNYKGGTNLILKQGMQDLYSPKEALTFCQPKMQAAYHLLKEEFGEKYPYTINDLIVYCQGSAVWLEDSNGNKYAMNDVTENLLKNQKKYKGNTNLILREGMQDLYTPSQALEISPRGIYIKYNEV